MRQYFVPVNIPYYILRKIACRTYPSSKNVVCCLWNCRLHFSRTFSFTPTRLSFLASWLVPSDPLSGLLFEGAYAPIGETVAYLIFNRRVDWEWGCHYIFMRNVESKFPRYGKRVTHCIFSYRLRFKDWRALLEIQTLIRNFSDIFDRCKKKCEHERNILLV